MTYERKWPDSWNTKAYCIAFKFFRHDRDRDIMYDRCWSREDASKWLAWHHRHGHEVLFMVVVTKREK